MTRCKEAKTIEVLKVVVIEGSGIVGDISRNVTYYYSKDGHLLAFSDPLEIRKSDLIEDDNERDDEIKKESSDSFTVNN